MNINITSLPGIHDAYNPAIVPDSNYREVKQPVQKTEDVLNEKRQREFKESIHKAVTMDTAEVRDFLFMLIGASIKVKPETENTGNMINRIA
ncbi:MAG TPA: hypothetical protein PK514_13150 [Spirochaetota bacterium]|nr:hypothetical protein [Spirochaetota bacterium]